MISGRASRTMPYDLSSSRIYWRAGSSSVATEGAAAAGEGTAAAAVAVAAVAEAMAEVAAAAAGVVGAAAQRVAEAGVGSSPVWVRWVCLRRPPPAQPVLEQPSVSHSGRLAPSGDYPSPCRSSVRPPSSARSKRRRSPVSPSPRPLQS